MTDTKPTDLVGRTISAVRPMTQKEQDLEGWFTPAMVLVLDDGTLLYPSRDMEGNGSGVLFGQDTDGNSFGIGLS